MAVNKDKAGKWKADTASSVDLYNDWFMKFAPKVFRDTSIKTTKQVELAMQWTNNLTNIRPEALQNHPSVLAILRMSTCPPIARERLAGLAGVSPYLIKSMEKDQRVPPRLERRELARQLRMIGAVIKKMADPDIFVWKTRRDSGTQEEVRRASSIIADRLCGVTADPVIRNAQEQRQLATIRAWLEARGYRELRSGEASDWRSMPGGTFAFRFNIPVALADGRRINIVADAAIMRKNVKKGALPVLLETKSSGDFANTNKRRKEEAIKVQQLRNTYGNKAGFYLFLCGYFDSSYLGYEAAEGIDWIWEHRIDDLKQLGF